MTYAPDQYVEKALANGRAQVDEILEDATAYTRTFPMRALLAALAAGYLFRVLPVGRLFTLVLRLTMRLARPMMLLYGASRFYRTQLRPAR